MDNESNVRLANAVALLHDKYGSSEGPRASNRIGPRDCAEVLAALDEFQESIRYLNTRRSKGAILELKSEADVQDALYLMLRPWIRDLVPEDPTGRSASRFALKDFYSRSLRTVIEAKYVRDKSHGRTISAELHDDIELYRRHGGCAHLIFFIYDPDSLIPDQRALVEAIQIERIYGGVPLHCYVVIKP
jgi:REase_DpnII-MboI